jgi:hypothetical protein
MERPLLAQNGRFASEPEAVALACAIKFESPPDSRPSMVCLCRASCFCRLLSSYRCCRSSRRLRRLITGRRHAGTATASCRAIISPRITAFQLTPRKLRFCAWRAATGALGISIRSQVITGTMATGTISAGLAFTAVATMAAPLALAGRGRRSGQPGIAADQAKARLLDARAVRFSEPCSGYALSLGSDLGDLASVLGEQQRHQLIDRYRQ